MKYFGFAWLLLVVLLFISSENVQAKPKIKIGFPSLPNLNLNLHHNNVHIG